MASMVDTYKGYLNEIESLGNGNNYLGFYQFMKAHQDDPQIQGFFSWLQSYNPSVYESFINNYVSERISRGEIGANDAYGMYGFSNVSPNEETQKYLDNLISQSNTAADRQFQTEMRDTSLISSGNQLSQLGLSPSNVIQVGSSSSGVTSQAADTSRMLGSINRKQQLAMNEYNQRMGMAKNLISMAGSMASSGIYGGALNAAKHSASVLASAASHSGLKANQAYSDPDWSNKWDAMLKDLGY